MIDAKYSGAEYVFRFFLLLEWGEERSQEINELSLEEVRAELDKTTPPEIKRMSPIEIELEMRRRLHANSRKKTSRQGGGVKKDAQRGIYKG